MVPDPTGKGKAHHIPSSEEITSGFPGSVDPFFAMSQGERELRDRNLKAFGSSVEKLKALQVECLASRDGGADPEQLQTELAFINGLRKVGDMLHWRPSYHLRTGEGLYSPTPGFLKPISTLALSPLGETTTRTTRVTTLPSDPVLVSNAFQFESGESQLSDDHAKAGCHPGPGSESDDSDHELTPDPKPHGVQRQNLTTKTLEAIRYLIGTEVTLRLPEWGVTDRMGRRRSVSADDEALDLGPRAQRDPKQSGRGRTMQRGPKGHHPGWKK